jgi:hypothetical protein
MVVVSGGSVDRGAFLIPFLSFLSFLSFLFWFSHFFLVVALGLH